MTSSTDSFGHSVRCGESNGREKVTIVDETDLAKPPAVRDVRACTTVLPVTRCAVNVGLVEAPCAYSLMLCCLADGVSWVELAGKKKASLRHTCSKVLYSKEVLG